MKTAEFDLLEMTTIKFALREYKKVYAKAMDASGNFIFADAISEIEAIEKKIEGVFRAPKESLSWNSVIA